MKKEMFIGLGLGFLVALLMVAWLFHVTETETANLNSREISAFLEMKDSDADDAPDGASHRYKFVGEDVWPYMIEDMCGYNPKDTTMGVITVRKDMDTTLYNKSFPKAADMHEVDSIPDVFLHIQPVRFFPKGEYGKVLYVITTDSFFQVQFRRMGMESMLDDMKRLMEDISMEINKLAEQDTLQIFKR